MNQHKEEVFETEVVKLLKANGYEEENLVSIMLMVLISLLSLMVSMEKIR